MQLKPRDWIKIDCLGAAASALSLGIILPQFPAHIAMPEQVLMQLAGIACVLMAVGLFALLTLLIPDKKMLCVLATLNSLYMVYTIAMVIGHQGQLLLWDYLYFVGELVIILVIIMQEIRFSRN
mgnify:CR=1 FL=1